MRIDRKPFSNEEIIDMCQDLLNKNLAEHPILISIVDFKSLYETIARMEDTLPVVSIVNQGHTASIQFSAISVQRFIIQRKEGFTKDDFPFVTDLEWHGLREKPVSFFVFLIEEFKLNLKWLLPIFILTFFILISSGTYENYKSLAELILQAATIFLSIFLIFTVTQNQKISSDKHLFSIGVISHFFLDDDNMTKSTMATILLAFLQLLLSFYFNMQPISMSISLKLLGEVTLTDNILMALLSAVSLTMLVNSFLSVTNYYFVRSRAIIEENLAQEILKDDFEKNNNS